MTEDGPNAIAQSLRLLLDKDRIETALKCYPAGIDGLDMPRFLAMFEEEIVLDLESWSGIAARRIRTRDWAVSFMGRLSGFDATQHLLSLPDIAVSGDEARSRPEFIAVHRLSGGDSDRIHAIGGHYEHAWRRRGEGWAVTALRLVLAWESGDRGLFDAAMARPDKRMMMTGE